MINSLPTHPVHRPGFSRLVAVVASLGLLAVMGSCIVLADWWSALPDDLQAGYVGRSSCIACHPSQAEHWTGSHHDLAMDHATSATVLADFENASLEHFGVTSTMFQRDGKYFVNTEGPDGQLADFQVKYVLGVEPLQQYMVEFDRPEGHPQSEIARLQVLRVSWDTEKKRWFYLAPPDVDEKLAPDDPLHWTRAGQNWNHMCASCHSTDLRKNYDPQTKTYHTTYSEIDVSCEACHGPGSIHVELAQSKSLFWDRKRGYGLKHLKSKDSRIEIETCAPCHSRRRTVHPDDPPGQDYYDCFANELLTPTTYYPDGQILDEVYVYGSFLQSKMYHKDVRCSDCHDPHTTKLKLPGNAMCTSCHTAHSAARYDTPAHHRHNQGSPGAQCANCHMPETPFMDVDFRRDHSIRVPRPDLSVDLGTPNACTGCHLQHEHVAQSKRDRLPHYAAWLEVARDGDEEVQAEVQRVDRWAADLYQQWYGNKYGRQEHFAYVLKKAWDREPNIVQPLRELARSRRNASIVRASALVQLIQLDPTAAAEIGASLLDESDPQIRIAAAATLETMPRKPRLRLLTPLLEDPVRAVRTEAARILADFGPQGFDARRAKLRDDALADYRRGLQEHADLAMSHMGLALLAERQQDLGGAIKAYRAAIDAQADVTGPRTNLAALLDRTGRQGEAAKLRAQELKLLARDARLAPNTAPIHYRYGLALYLAGQQEKAKEAMTRACLLEPDLEEFRLGLTLLLEGMGERRAALQSVDRLLQIAPDNPGNLQLKRRIQAMPD